MTTKKPGVNFDRVIVALDTPDRATAENLMGRLKGTISYFKVGPILFTLAGPSFVEWLKEQGMRVFLDLKFHDIPHVVEGACRNAALLGVDMLTVHSSGGLDMMKAARAGCEAGAASKNLQVPIVLGVTVLTSYAGRVRGRVVPLARLAKKSGLPGVVASGFEAREVRRACGQDFVIVVPGIRPAGRPKHDQRSVSSATQAFKAGADFIVIGRPIIEAEDPIQALRRL